MYKVTSSEERNEKATEFETKSMLYMMNYYTNADEICWFVIDFFNDVTGVDQLQAQCFDIQSKGVKKITPMQLGRYLVTLFKNYISDFNFADFILFIESVSPTIQNELGDKKTFLYNDLSETTKESIKEGLITESSAKTYIEDKSAISDENISNFLNLVTFVIDSHSKEEYIKDAVQLSSAVIVDDAYLRKIFKEIRDKQSSKKNNNAEGKLLTSIGSFIEYDKYIRKDTIQDFIMNRICFKNALNEIKAVPTSFTKLIKNVDETIYDKVIETSQNDVFRLLYDKNNKEAYWNLFSEVVRIIKSNPTFDIDDIYCLIDENKIKAVHHLNTLSCKYFISLIKEGLK